MNLSLEILKGPLDDKLLHEITLTYGEIDNRYKSLEFCNGLFNKNPFGYSLHAFVLDKEKIVGHYSLIPMYISCGDAQILSGKGEALFLKEEYRSASISVNGSELPVAWGLIRGLNEFGLRNGMKLVHNYSPQEIGVFLRMIGFSKIEIKRDQHHFIYSPFNIPQINKKYQFAAKLLSLMQSITLGIMDTVLNQGKQKIAVNSSNNLMAHITLFQKYGCNPENKTWSVSKETETLKWMIKLDLLEFISSKKDSAVFYVLKKGKVAEILFKSAEGNLVSELSLFCSILKHYKKSGVLILSADKAILENNPLLNVVAKILLFFPRSFKSQIYVKSDDKFFMKPENLSFSRLFNL